MQENRYIPEQILYLIDYPIKTLKLQAVLFEKFEEIRPLLDQHHKGLTKKNLLVNFPWVVCDGYLQGQKVIFKNGNRLVASINGMVSDGTWEYINSAKSLIVEFAGRKVLLNEVFFDGVVLVLKRDGSEEGWVLMVNEAKLSTLDVGAHLMALTNSKNTNHDMSNQDATFDPVIMTALIIFLIIVLLAIF